MWKYKFVFLYYKLASCDNMWLGEETGVHHSNTVTSTVTSGCSKTLDLHISKSMNREQAKSMQTK